MALSDLLLGGGLIAGAGALDQEPGEVAQARQFLRNRFTSPTALSDQFSGQLAGLTSSFQPLLDQQRQQDIADITKRYATAFPATAGAQGPEFGGLTNYITQQALPREDALKANLAQWLVGQQGQAASDLLNYTRPNPFASGLAQLGSSLVNRDLLSTLTGSGTTSLFSGLTGSGQIGALSGLSSGVSQLLGLGGQPAGGGSFDPSGMAAGALWQLPNGQTVPVNAEEAQRLQQAGIGQAVGQGAGMGGGLLSAGGLAGGLAAAGKGVGGLFSGLPGLSGLLSGQGLLGAPGLSSGLGIASGLGAAGGGYALGRMVGQRLPNEALGTAGGAAAGAATGLAVGGPVGALIGAVAGGLGGFFGKSSAIKDAKQASIDAETAQTNQQRPAALQTAAQVYQASQQFHHQYDAAVGPVSDAFDAALQAGNPQAQALASQIQQLASQSGVGLTTATGVPTGATGGSLTRALAQLADRGGQYDPANASNPDSRFSLLQSTEVGKFGPGSQDLAATVNQVQSAISLFQQLMQTVGVA